jgi:hypothetical protein
LRTNRGKLLWKKRRNGGSKVEHYGFRQEMTTPSFFIDMKIVGKTLTQYGK